MPVEQLPCERVNLGMICVCGEPGSDRKKDALAKADATYERAKTRLPDDGVLDDREFMTYAVAYLWWNHEVELKLMMDQWFGVAATYEKYVTCGHSPTECPDEPECFVRRWDPALSVYVECDRVEDGVAAIVNWFLDLDEWNEAVKELDGAGNQ